MLTREQVAAAYQALLGRDPRDDREWQTAIAMVDVAALRRHVLTSREFAPELSLLILANGFPLDCEPAQRVDVAAAPAELQRLLERVRDTWVRFGELDPYWSVLAWDIFKDGGIARNPGIFWQSGKGDIGRMKAWLERHAIAPDAARVCLEYGCGTGRDTRWLCEEFRSVIALDISRSHLKLAAENLAREQRSAQFIEVADLAVFDRLPEFDLIFSLLVLQHNPPPLIAFVLDRLLARLRPGGVAYFQVPTLCRGYSFDLDSYLASEAGPDWEMHVLPQRDVFAILQRNSCEVLEVQADDKVGSLDYISNTFLAQKRRP